MDILYQDNSILVCIKPAGVLSTDEPGGMPELVRQALGDPKACVRTVHRLDRVVSGLMVLARTPGAASKLSAQIREHDFGKTYLAVVHGAPSPLQGTYRDLLRRDPNERKTYVTDRMAKGVQEAVLDYDVLGTRAELSLVRIYLRQGARTRSAASSRRAVCRSGATGSTAPCPTTGRSRSGRTACTLPTRKPARCSTSSSSRRTAIRGTDLPNWTTEIPRAAARGKFLRKSAPLSYKMSCERHYVPI